MNKKISVVMATMIVVGITLFFLLTPKRQEREPIIIESSASYAEMTLDVLINEADLIIIGAVETTFPGRWNTPDGKLPEGITAKTITPEKIIFTDVNFKVDQTLKDRSNQQIVRIRSLGGTVEQDQMTVDGVASLETGKIYLLFLGRDTTGSTADINPGHYFVRGGLQGMYQILDGKAISFRDEWLLEDLVAYIQNALQNSQ